ncbi:hypothetical protein DY000_02010105 [Brassica cretica]|uniref:Uncharacterized protein n=1 Tax=Brassica cretica TaxID=69181 RepID=A0ABQ7CLQ2_BRACR|nr:hypothetical protein DY000_02010105 [Brassica cretica]
MRRFEFWSPSTNLSRRPMHVSALDVEGRCYTWGRNEKGQLGHGDMIQRDRPTVVSGLSNFDWIVFLVEDQPEKFQTHFSQYLKKGVDAEGMEELVLVL